MSQERARSRLIAWLARVSLMTLKSRLADTLDPDAFGDSKQQVFNYYYLTLGENPDVLGVCDSLVFVLA